MNANLKQRAKRLMKWSLVALALYISYFIFVMKPSGEPRKCEHYTKLFNGGGIKTYAGKEYLITMCAYGRYGWTDDEKIGIRVYDNSTHELLAMRFFWLGMGGGQYYYAGLVGVEKDHLYYPGENDDGGIIRLPPTWWDWIYARLP